MRVCASILPDVYPKFSLLKTAAKVQKKIDICKFKSNFFQKMIYSFSNIFPTVDYKTKKYLHISKKSSTFAAESCKGSKNGDD